MVALGQEGKRTPFSHQFTIALYLGRAGFEEFRSFYSFKKSFFQNGDVFAARPETCGEHIGSIKVVALEDGMMHVCVCRIHRFIS